MWTESRKSAEYLNRREWAAPFSGRILEESHGSWYRDRIPAGHLLPEHCSVRDTFLEETAS